jgi:methylenetetrahydrofolate dehydrogenase (NADP+)/methenyltetrahydrofolate cyclohydrolase
MATLLTGAPVRDAIYDEVRERVSKLKRAPGLAVVLVGHNPASEIYVRNKVKACADLGLYSEKLTPPDSISTGELLEIVDRLNRRDEIDGILVQMPLPAQVDSKRVLDAIAPEKDVDGFHPCNVGKLVANTEGPRPCTPAGVMRLLEHYKVPVSGRHAVVVGRSDIVGKPMAFLLLHQHATVTICHSKTPDLPAVCRSADILVAAMGRPAMLTAEYIKRGSVVIDVGINRLDSEPDVVRAFRGNPAKLAALKEKGNVLVGDVHPVDAMELAAGFTPVPGGVGPLTIAMLMLNTTRSAERRQC